VADLTTLAAVKAYAGITHPADDTLLSGMIAAYSEWVRSYTNRDFTVTDYDLWRSGRGAVVMLLPQFPIVDVTLVQIDGVSIPRAPSFAGYGYRFTQMSVILGGGPTFSVGAQNVYVEYSAGYAVVPADIAQAVNELVALRYNLRDKLEWSSKSLAGETVSLVQRDMPASVKTLLDQYANPVPI
jgi:hypothetical protein